MSLKPLLVTSFFGCVAIYAVISGLYWKHATVQEQNRPHLEHAETQEAWFKSLQDAQAGLPVSSALAHPMNLAVLVQRPPGVLGQFGYSREDLYPSAGTINGFSNEALIFRRYELEAPTALMHGRLDLTFVVVVLLPLVLCLLNYDHIARDRERGSLRVLLVQGVRPITLLWSRVFYCSLPSLIVLLLASIVGTLAAGKLNWETCLSLVWWCSGIALYWMLWVTLCALIAACSRNSLSAALSSVTVWIGLVVVLPALLQFTVSNIAASPSKVQLMAVARAAEADALGTLDQREEAFIAQHATELPQSVENFSDYYRRAYLSNASVNERVGTLLDQYQDELSADLRLLNAIQFVSPSTAAFRMLQAISGSGFERAETFQNQARRFFREYFQEIGVATLQQRRLTLAEARSIADFSFREPLAIATLSSSVAGMCVFVLVFTLVTNLTALRMEGTPD